MAKLRGFQIFTLLVLSVLVQSYPSIRSCEEARKTGIYTIEYKNWKVDVICDMDTDGGGWLVILNRQGGHQNFFMPWAMFRDRGVGSPETEYILPLQFLHEYLNQFTYELLEEMSEGGDKAWGFYSYLALGSEQENYKLKMGGQDHKSTKGGNDWVPLPQFTTYDAPNYYDQKGYPLNCHSAGWLDFYEPRGCNPLGNYENNKLCFGIFSSLWRGYNVSLDTFSWKVRRSVCVSGFGSKCKKCAKGYYLSHKYERVGCYRNCDIEGCRGCFDKFYLKCENCKTGYQLAEDGLCTRSL